MFTIKLYTNGASRTRILEADSFTILRDAEGAEITLHRSVGADCRYDIKPQKPPRGVDEPADYDPPRFDKAIIENSAGQTTEVIRLMPAAVPRFSGDFSRA